MPYDVTTLCKVIVVLLTMPPFTFLPIPTTPSSPAAISSISVPMSLFLFYLFTCFVFVLRFCVEVKSYSILNPIPGQEKRMVFLLMVKNRSSPPSCWHSVWIPPCSNFRNIWGIKSEAVLRKLLLLSSTGGVESLINLQVTIEWLSSCFISKGHVSQTDDLRF